MDYETYFENSAFTEWYHYVLLFAWLVLLFVGLKYVKRIESFFKPQEGFNKGEKYTAYLLSGSFILGLILFLSMTFQSEQQASSSKLYFTWAIYGIFFLYLMLNAVLTFRKYKPQSLLFRLILISFIMVIYFYSGVLGGLMVVAVLALIIVIYTFIKFKNILSLKQ